MDVKLDAVLYVSLARKDVKNTYLLWLGSSNVSSGRIIECLRRLGSVHTHKGKVKFSHTRYRALGPELIPVYRQSACMSLEAIHSAVGCHYFPPGLRLPSQPKMRHRPSAGTKLYCLVTAAHACEQLAQGCYLEANRPRFDPATFRIASKCSSVKPHRPDIPISVA